MYKRVVGEYVKDELRKGKAIEQIRKRLVKSGHDKKEVDEVLRTFEYRETDLKNKGNMLATQRTRVHMLLAIILLISIINLVFFFYYFSNPDYVLIRETPTGFVTTGITEEELRNLESSLNVSGSIGGLSKVSVS